MVQMVRTRIEGAAELDRVLKALPAKMGLRALDSAVRKGANLVKNETMVSAPSSQYAVGRVRSRRVKKSVTGRSVKALYGKLKYNIKVVADRKTEYSVTMRVTTGRAFWALFQEFGRKGQSARPFFRPAFERVKFKALEIIGLELGKNLEREARKLAGPLAKTGLVKRRRR